MRCFLSILGLMLLSAPLQAQMVPAGHPALEEALRRKQLLGEYPAEVSFMQRPLKAEWSGSERFPSDSWDAFRIGDENTDTAARENTWWQPLPIRNFSRYGTARPYGNTPGRMVPAVGMQTLVSAGVEGRYKRIYGYFQPEILLVENRRYTGFEDIFGNTIARQRFHFWNNGDPAERLAAGPFVRAGWGNSKLALQAGAFEAGLSTENIWWGPGQFHALTISNQAAGFLHLTLNTHKPLKTFIGHFETQMVMGRLINNRMPPSQRNDLNDRFHRPMPGSSRFMNGLNIVYSPNWLSGLSLGFSRTFQQYFNLMGRSLGAWFPVFDPFQKSRFFEDEQMTGYDRGTYDQQAAVYARYMLPRVRMELYAEYGRRDHAYNWREFVLNPEHARGYLLGFNKLFPTAHKNTWVQVKGEMVHGSQSLHPMVRYTPLYGGYSWHMHSRLRGFKNHGENMGIGAGAGTNLQTLELSIVEGINKYGILLERAANHMDFYYRAFHDLENARPWVDFSGALLATRQWDRFLIDGRLQAITAYNYQWRMNADTESSLPRHRETFSILAQVHFYYLIDWK